MDSLRDLKQRMERVRGQRQALTNQLRRSKKQIMKLKEEQIVTLKAQKLIQLVAKETQEELEYSIAEVTSLALSVVYKNPYALKLNFKMKKGRTQCIPMFTRNGHEYNPKKRTGGGPVDIAAIALRCALWSLRRPRTRNSILLDEPFRFLDEKKHRQGLGIRVVQELSKALGIQFILVSHEQGLIKGSDKVIKIGIKNEVSYIDKERNKIIV